MLNEKIAKLVNEQVNKELYSGYLYLDFANYYADEGLDGFAHWYEVQAQEERDHAMMMRRYLIDNGIRVTFDAIAKPDKKFADLTAPLKAGYEHEQYVTSLINNIYAEAFALKDFKTMQFLDWFIKEQGEEEKNAEDMLKKMELFGHDAKGLYALNQELLARVYAPSTTGPAM
ncbi:MAG: ferritin [Clostridiales bacterium]|nr:ferritin [Clostridiales bacterium]